MNAAQVVIVMGVSGCGKSTVASALANNRNWRFIDADTYHPANNVEKMRNGTPLTDEDRWPWLARLNAVLRHSSAKGESIVLACSALKNVYREKLMEKISKAEVHIAHLQGSFELIEARMQAREHQYMPSSLLKSQFATLEVPEQCISVPIDIELTKQIELINKALNKKSFV